MQDKKTARKRARRKEARPGEIVAAAMRAFCEEGFGGAKIEDIADRAGVAKGTVYLYFKSKEDLFDAVVRDNITPTVMQIDDLVDAFEGPTSELLTHVIQHFYQDVIEHEQKRAILRILIGEGARFPHLAAFYHQEVVVRAKRMLTKVIRRGIERGEFRDTPVLRSPEVVMGPAILAAIWKIVFEPTSPLDPKRYARAHVDLVLNGLLSRS